MGDMDSGNSGSMQSSSTGGGGGGGDEQEYESRGESSFPSFFNPPNFPVNPFDNARLLQLYSLNNGSSSGSMFDQHHQQQQQQGQVFDSLETANFMAQSNSASNNSHMEMVWANKFGCLRSTQSDEATCTPTTATAPGYNNNSNPMSTPQVQLGGHVPPLHSLQGPATGVPSGENSPRSSTQNPNPNQNQNVNTGGVGSGGGPGRNPKKRSRASRRAPTTVLTTDTTNFRQMVQEFTGIPAPPFSAAGFSTRTRLDLFGGMGMGMGMGMSMGMGMGLGTGMGILPRAGGGGGSTNLDQPSYLLRPFAQKVLPHPSPSPLHPQQQQRNTSTSTSTGTASALAEATVGAASASATGSTAGNTIMSSSTSDAANGATIPATFNLSPQNVLQPPNPMFAFQSLLQPSSTSPASDKYPLPLIQRDAGMDKLGSKATGSGSSGTAATAQGSRPGGEGGPQSWAGLHQGLGLTPSHDHHHLPPHRTSGGSVNEGVGNLMSSGTDTSNSQRAAPINGTSDNHGNVVRGERGMVDSWICSSD